MRRTKPNQKGKFRRFSTPEEIQSQMAKIDLNEEDDVKEEGSGSGSEDDSSSDEDTGKPKGVDGLIEISNPNRAPPKKSAAAVDPNAAPEPVQLSRREREEIEKQKARERYQKLHAAGKTDQAKADLARLAMIKQKREEEAAKRREEANAKADKSKRPGTSK